MQNKNVAAILLIAMLLFPSSGVPMNNDILSVTANCRNNPACKFTGADIIIDVSVQNVSATDVYFPLTYLKARGPTGKLVNNLTSEERPLPLNLAPHELKEIFLLLKPSQTVTFDTTIRRYEISSLSGDSIDITAIIIPAVNIRLGRDTQTRPFRGSATLHIVDNSVIQR